MYATVIVCTWNRARSLARTLSSMTELIAAPSDGWEVLVIDNGSQDDTQEVVRTFERRLPIRIAHEPRLGVAHARNAGVDRARGELLLFTDDDVLVDPAWLRAYVEAAERSDADYFGGHIDAAFEETPPRWLRQNARAFRPMLCAVDLSTRGGPIGPNDQPFGPNMAYRRSALENTRFDPAVGRRGTNHVRGSDVAIIETLRHRGARGLWVPAAKVRHVIPPERATLRYLWRYHAGAGATAVRLGGEDQPATLPRIARSAAATLATRMLGRSDWPVHLGRAAHYIGARREHRRRERHA